MSAKLTWHIATTNIIELEMPVWRPHTSGNVGAAHICMLRFDMMLCQACLVNFMTADEQLMIGMPVIQIISSSSDFGQGDTTQVRGWAPAAGAAVGERHLRKLEVPAARAVQRSLWRNAVLEAAGSCAIVATVAAG